MSGPDSRGLKISKDGSRVFCLDVDYYGNQSLQALSLWMGEPIGEAQLKGRYSLTPYIFHPCQIDGAKALIHCAESTQCWDFGTPDSIPTQLPKKFLDQLNFHPINIRQGSNWRTRIEDRVTGKEVFKLPRRFAESPCVRWDNQYLIVCSWSGEMLILKYNMSL